jgi:hypothetical protein
MPYCCEQFIVYIDFLTFQEGTEFNVTAQPVMLKVCLHEQQNLVAPCRATPCDQIRINPICVSHSVARQGFVGP